MSLLFKGNLDAPLEGLPPLQAAIPLEIFIGYVATVLDFSATLMSPAVFTVLKLVADSKKVCGLVSSLS